MGKLTDKVAVITGASKGIGAGIAKAFAAEGAAIVVNYAASRRDAERWLRTLQQRVARHTRSRPMFRSQGMSNV